MQWLKLSFLENRGIVMLLILKLLGCGLLLLALALGSAACSVKTPTEGLRTDRGEKFKVLETEKSASAQKIAAQPAKSKSSQTERSAQSEAVVKPAKPEEKPVQTAQPAAAPTQPAAASVVETASTPALVSEPAPAQLITPSSSGENFTLYFKRGSTEYAKDSQGEIRTVVRLLREHPEWRAVIEGYTDSRGDPETNLYLSSHRALRLKAALQRQADVAPARLSAKGYGATNYVAENETLEGRELNRRVTVRFVRDEDGSPVGPLTPMAKAPEASATPSVAAVTPQPVQAPQTSLPAATPVTAATVAATVATTPNPVPAPAAFAPQPPIKLLDSGQSAFSTALKTSDAPKMAPKDLAVGAPAPAPELAGRGSVAMNAAASATQLNRPSVPKAEDVVYTPLPGDANLLAKRHYIEISVNRCALTLYELQLDGSKKLVKEYKVATAKKGTPYPEGMGEVTAIETNPWWFPTDNMKRRAASRGQTLEPVPPGSKSNPMGAIKIHLSHENDGGSYRIHGTNAPSQIGRRVSMGCVRMHNKDGLELANIISVGTEVNIMY
jgi:outer membrane protein OmpA-like peptidoglycan-associated protein